MSRNEAAAYRSRPSRGDRGATRLITRNAKFLVLSLNSCSSIVVNFGFSTSQSKIKESKIPELPNRKSKIPIPKSLELLIQNPKSKIQNPECLQLILFDSPIQRATAQSQGFSRPTYIALKTG